MSGSTENTAPSASERPERRDVMLNLATAGRMVALVRRIIADWMELQRPVARLREELDRLDRHRRDLVWLERQRRYQVRDELAAVDRRSGEVLGELDCLGVVLIDAAQGQVGFPTLVNDRRAYFSWKPGEDTLAFWHFAGEEVRRPIPASWVKAADIRLAARS